MSDSNSIFPKNFSNYLANLFKEVRQEAGLTQEQMATILGTSQKVYQRWETGNTEPTGEFTAKLFLYRDYLLKERENPLKFDTPEEISKKVLDEIEEPENIILLLRERVKPIVITIKDLLWYAHYFGHTPYNKINRPPFHIEWLPNSIPRNLQVILNFKEIRKSITVLEVHDLGEYTDINNIKVRTYLPGKWIFVLEQAVNRYKSHSHMRIIDDPFLPEMLRAFGLDEET